MSTAVEIPINAADTAVEQTTSAPANKLTRRELEVLGLLADGKSSKQVASILGITFKTAACHRYRILRKFDAHECVTAARRAIREGIIQA
jgi:two-component system nitrate/nitrite response regulator NarL